MALLSRNKFAAFDEDSEEEPFDFTPSSFRLSPTGVLAFVIFLGLLGSVYLNVVQRGQIDTARSRELAARSMAVADQHALPALWLSKESGEAASTLEARTQARSVLAKNRVSLPLKGHENRLWEVTWSGDGRRLATSSEDDTARIWDNQGHLIITLEGHECAVNTVALTQSGDTAITGAIDGGVWLWNVPEGTMRLKLEGHTDEVYVVAVDPQGELVLTASDDKTARLFSMKDGSEVARLKGHKGWVRYGMWQPGGERLLTASYDGNVRIWNREGELLHTLAVSDNPVLSARFSPDGQLILVITEDKVASIWSAEGQRLKSIEGPQSGITAGGFSSDSERVALGYFDGTLVLNDVDGDWREVIRNAHDERILHLAFSPDGRKIATSSSSGGLKVWTASGLPIVTLAGHEGSIPTLEWRSDSLRLATASADGFGAIWLLPASEILALEGAGENLYGAEISPNGEQILLFGEGKDAFLFESDGSIVGRLSGHAKAINHATFSPDSQTILTVSDDKTARLFSKDGSPLAVLEGHQSLVFYGAFSPDGSRIATASRDGSLRIWDNQGKELKVLTGHTGPVFHVDWRPDGQQLASASGDNRIGIWSADGENERFISVHLDRVWEVFYDPTGQYVLSASSDRSGRITKVDDPPTYATLGDDENNIHRGTVRGVAWNTDGTRALTVADDGLARIWERDGEKAVVLIATLRGHKGPIRDGLFLPTGGVLTASDDGTLRVWGADGTLDSVVRNHDAALQSVRVSPDGKQFITAAFDGRAQTGYVHSEDVFRQVSYLITRLLTDVEREDFGLDPR